MITEAKYRVATTALAALSVLLAMPIRTASADAFPLPRTPYIALSTGAVPESRCDLDEDGNGLDDETELQIARAAAPELRFDGHENARDTYEPYTLFNIRRVPGELGVLRIRYSMLYKRDGGAVYSALCGTSHNGDSETLTVDVKIAEATRGWIGEVVRINNRTSFLRSGTHSVVFLSAGKKHLYYAPGLYRFGVDCPDGAGGDGAWVTPGTSVVRRVGGELVTTPHAALFHAPLFFASGRETARDRARGWKSNAPLLDDRSGWWNACLAGLHPTDRSRWRPATRSLTGNNLGSVFPGEAIEGECFRGGLGGDCTVADPVWFVLSDKLADAMDGASLRVGGVLDADGDANPEFTGLLSLAGSNFAFRATDECPDDPRDAETCDPASMLERVALRRGSSPFTFSTNSVSSLFSGVASTTRDWHPFAEAPAPRALDAWAVEAWGNDSRMHAVTLSDVAHRMGVRPVDSLVVPISGRPIDRPNAILSAIVGARGDEPELLWVGRESVAARWVRLRARSIGSGPTVYDVTDSGTIDAALSPRALLLADAHAESAAIVDPEAGALLAFDPYLRVWVRSRASLAGVRDRIGAAWALRGGRVWAFGGRVAGASIDDAWAFETFGERAIHLDGLWEGRLQLWSAQGALLDGQFRR